MTKTNRRNFFRTFSSSWLLVFTTLSLVVAVASFVFETYQAKSSIEKYVSIWEDDISKAILFDGDVTLQNKILSQLNEVQSSVSKTQVRDSTSLKCLIHTDAPITFNSLPAGNIRVCFSPAKLAVKALSSPIFVLGLFVGMIFLGFGFRRELINRLNEQKLASELEMNKQISSMARQVAHDIRGPLTALATLSKLSHEMSSEKRDMFDLAVTRIQGIAEDLLQRGSKKEAAVKSKAEVVALLDVATIAEGLLKEFRFSHPQIQFTLNNHLETRYVLDMEVIKAQRILSNLLNNAIESCQTEEAFVGVQLQRTATGVQIQIMDNGRGIPEEHLKVLGQEGVTFGKEKGNGLGIYDAKTSLQSYGGDLTIQSRVGVGTQVNLQIPAQSVS